MSETTTPVDISTIPAKDPGPVLLKTKTPSVIGFGVGLLLFFLPFLDIKCNSMVLQKVSGVQLATGFKVGGPGTDNSLVGNLERLDNYNGNVNLAKGRRSPNIPALVALVLGIAGLALALRDVKKGSFIAAALAVAALIITMIDVKSKLKSEMTASRQADLEGFSTRGSFNDDVLLSVDFAPGFYLAILAFAAAGYFSYRWIRGR
jgi:hypothetical protein